MDSRWAGGRGRRTWRETGHVGRWGGERIPEDDSWVCTLRKEMCGGETGGGVFLSSLGFEMLLKYPETSSSS